MGRIAIVVCLAVLGACASTPPGAAVIRSPMPVTASFDRTWTAVIDVFAERNVPIETLDRSSGLIVARPLSVPREDAQYADCGTAMGLPIPPSRAMHNVRVRGDSASSTVQITVRWEWVTTATSISAETANECSTKGVWETMVERQIKERAERTGG